MSLSAYIQKRQSEGVANARQIHDEVTRPVVTVTNGKEARPTANLEAEFKALVVPALMANAVWNATLPEERDELIETRLVNKMGAQDLTTDGFVALAKLQAQIVALKRKIERRGGDASGPDAGKAERPTVSTSTGPALWQTWGLPAAPTVKEIRGAMR